ncbi:hypothetical protein RvY_01078 [Ramazzottius varieornatus]|uniref:Uncharacterized protein n=1 Tax=Ramazzottius varieornatus TaxID=947166 RepID=A0A1D1UQD3_RAMVA|nr:hypothetical protein RvY_01078 [Ramazzottius varieornatus]
MTLMMTLVMSQTQSDADPDCRARSSRSSERWRMMRNGGSLLNHRWRCGGVDGMRYMGRRWTSIAVVDNLGRWRSVGVMDNVGLRWRRSMVDNGGSRGITWRHIGRGRGCCMSVAGHSCTRIKMKRCRKYRKRVWGIKGHFK